MLKTYPKTYAFGEKTLKDIKYEEETKQLYTKWADDFSSGKIQLGNISIPSNRSSNKQHIEQKNRRVELDEDDSHVIVENCVRCGQTQPITPLYFTSTVGKKGRVNNIDTESGMEKICNSQSRPCRICLKELAQLERNNQDETIRLLLKSYPKLNRKWYDRIPNMCDIFNLPLTDQPNVKWRVSIQNNGSTREHLPEYCTKIAYELNVQQHTAIPNLKECYKELFKMMVKELHSPTSTIELVRELTTWRTNSPAENGVDVKWNEPGYGAQSRYKHLPQLLAGLRGCCMVWDKKSKRNPATAGICVTAAQLFNKMVKQGFKCYYTGIPFTKNRDCWRYFSLERLDNSLNHTDENTVFICRMFNTAGQLNRHMIHTGLLSQILVPLSDEDRTLIIAARDMEK